MKDQPDHPGLPAAAAEILAQVGYDSKNPHGGYQYASIDAVYAHARASLLEAGWIPWQHETSFELIERQAGSKTSTWMRVTYEMALTRGGPPGEGEAETVTMIGRFLDIQSCGSVRSYAAKYWLRGKLMLATGDTDADHSPAAAKPNPKPSKPAKSTEESGPLTDETLASLQEIWDGLDADGKSRASKWLHEHHGQFHPSMLDEATGRQVLAVWRKEPA